MKSPSTTQLYRQESSHTLFVNYCGLNSMCPPPNSCLNVVTPVTVSVDLGPPEYSSTQVGLTPFIKKTQEISLTTSAPMWVHKETPSARNTPPPHQDPNLQVHGSWNFQGSPSWPPMEKQSSTVHKPFSVLLNQWTGYALTHLTNGFKLCIS